MTPLLVLLLQGLYFLLRLLLPNASFPPSLRQLTPYILTAIPQLVLFRHLSTVGSPRRDSATGTLIAPGEDLNASGVTEWCFDVIYVTWACQVGSALLGEFVWWLYLSVSPAFLSCPYSLCHLCIHCLLTRHPPYLIDPSVRGIQTLVIRHKSNARPPQPSLILIINCTHRGRRRGLGE